MMAETKAKIEKHIRRHRKHGGKAESPEKGNDEAEADLKSKPADRSNTGNGIDEIGKEAEETKAKKGGRIKKAHGGMAHKKEVGMEGMEAMHHAGRKRRASGGSCEANPFSSALKGTEPRGRRTEHESKGYDH